MAIHSYDSSIQGATLDSKVRTFTNKQTNKQIRGADNGSDNTKDF